MRAISFLKIVRDLVLQLGVQHQLAAAEPRDGRDGHVVGGRSQPAAGDDQVHTLVGQEPQLGLDVGGAVAADGDVGQLDAQFEQPVGDPRAVAVGDPSGQNLGPRDDDARACAHRYDIRRAVSLRVPGLRGQVTLHRFRLAGHRVGHT